MRTAEATDRLPINPDLRELVLDLFKVEQPDIERISRMEPKAFSALHGLTQETRKMSRAEVTSAIVALSGIQALLELRNEHLRAAYVKRITQIAWEYPFATEPKN